MDHTFHLQHVASGEIRVFAEEGEFQWYSWTEGNYSCDCNRSLEFQRAGGIAERNIALGSDDDCGYGKYRVVAVHDMDTGELVYDEEES